ncbi:MAG TPA: hypothetical protein VNL16_08040 [Chloroflexota bacterium]|nr:hypothetical protein [Chloroflexota bacterium]
MPLSWSGGDRRTICDHIEELAGEIDRVLVGVTPRAASVTLMLFDRVVARYERENGRTLSESERETILAILRHIVARDGREDLPTE